MEPGNESRPPGRPSKYRPEFDDQAYKLSLLGMTLEELATFFEVVVSTISLWKIEHPSFSDAIARGGVIADGEIAASLHHRAKGYSHPAVKIFMPAGADKPVFADYTEHYPPDTHAASIWLWNRRRDKWRKAQDPADDPSNNQIEIIGGLPEPDDNPG